MNRIQGRMIIAFVASLVTGAPTANAEPIDGLLGIRLGSKPEILREIDKMKELGARLVLVSAGEDDSPDCLALLDGDGKVVQVKFAMPSLPATQQTVMNELRKKHGEPALSGSIEENGARFEFNTFFSGGGAVCCEVGREMLRIECTAVAAMTNLLANARRPRDSSVRGELERMGRRIGYMPTPRRPDKPFEIGSTDRVWRFTHLGAEVVIVHDGRRFWLRKDGEWGRGTVRATGGIFKNGDSFMAELDVGSRNGLKAWYTSPRVGGGNPMIDLEPMPAAFADTPVDKSVYGIWERKGHRRETIIIKEDGTMKWEGRYDGIDEWRWRSRCGSVIALPADFDPAYESYGDVACPMRLSPEGELIDHRSCRYAKKLL